MPTKSKAKTTVKKVVTPAPKTTAKPVRSVVAKKPAARKPAPRKPVAIAAQTERTPLYPSPAYTRWTLVTVGEFYLLSILFALVVLGILYWATAMSTVWGMTHMFVR